LAAAGSAGFDGAPVTCRVSDSRCSAHFDQASTWFS
jgi:hypothetical protein